VAKAKRKLTRKDNPAYAHAIDLAGRNRHIASMYYTSDGENPEPTRTPEPAAGMPRAPKEGNKIDHVRSIFVEWDQKDRGWRSLKITKLVHEVGHSYTKQSEVPSRPTIAEARKRHIAGHP
jgi:hypothetical protein